MAYHASGRSAALYEANYGHPVTVALNKALAARRMKRSTGGVLSPRGLMLLGGPGQEAEAEADIASMALQPIPLEEARARVPILDTSHVTRAAFHDEAWDLDTDRMVQHFARTIRSNGGQVRTGATATAISRDGKVWRVTTSDGADHTARVLLNAAGAWADSVAVLAGLPPLGLQPLRRSIARMPAPGQHDVSGWPMLIGAGESWYAKPDAGAWLVSPAEEHPVPEPHDAFADDMVLAEGIARYQPFVTEEVTRVTGSWAGLRTFAPDRCLVLGPDPLCPDFVWIRRSGRLRVPDRTSREPARRRAYRGARTCPAGRYRRGAAPRPAEVRAVGRRVTRSETHHSGGRAMTSSPSEGDPRRSAPAALRNRDAIAQELARLAPRQRARARESRRAAGSMSSAFASALPGLRWQPTDPDPAQRASVAAWIAAEGSANIDAPRALDVSQPGWALDEAPADLVVVVNLLHLITAPRDAGRAGGGSPRSSHRAGSPCSTDPSCAMARPRASATPPFTPNSRAGIPGSATRTWWMWSPPPSGTA